MASQDYKKLSLAEKNSAMGIIFNANVDPSKYVKNPGQFICDNFSRIDGFDARWSSLITNNPLLFEDVDYVRIKNYVNNTITNEEIEAYKRGDLRDMYATFDSLLACNLKYYDRIMNFCTMIFYHYMKIGNEIYDEHFDNIPYELEMTPTKIWCCVMMSTKSTEWELNYGWGNNNRKYTEKPIEGSPKSFLEVNWNKLYKNPAFARFVEYTAFRCSTSGFRATQLADNTDNRRLSQVCAKYTKSSVALSEYQLESLSEYIDECERVKETLYTALDDCLAEMYEGDKSKYMIFIFANEFFIYTDRFSIKVRKDEKGVITKSYLANSYECFMAEKYLANSIRQQIDWAKYKVPIKYEYDKQILKSLLENMLNNDHKTIICYKRMNDYGITAKVKFIGHWKNVIMEEELRLDGMTKHSSKKELGKKNAADWLIERGYYMCGIEKDCDNLVEYSKENVIRHYSNYCIPVMSFMGDVVAANIHVKNDIIDVVCKGYLDPARINNHNIRYTNLIEIDPRKIMQTTLQKQNARLKSVKRGLWSVLEGD